jgi:hypothetical protein
MGKIVVINHVTLDGVMQSPGRPDEDPRDGFEHGGWARSGGSDPAQQQIMGGQLIRTLRRHHLVDEYLLMIHPLLLGTGRRLFADDGAVEALRLVDATTTSTGVVAATYLPARSD